MYPVIRVDRRRAEAVEPLGTKSKFWFTNEQRVRTLFKAEDRGTGEDWAEKICCELAALIGLPHVQYDLALEVETVTPGAVCPSMITTPNEMRLGNQLLRVFDPAYPDVLKYHVSHHTLDAVAKVLDIIRSITPDSFNAHLPAGMETAIDIFSGYLMLDAWVANQDRHHENWAALVTNGRVFLAPSFDHGASLARNLSDEERYDRLTSKDRGRQIPTFARRARSALYAEADDLKALTTAAAWSRFAKLTPKAAIWLEQLQNVEPGQVREIVQHIPPERMSAVCREFTLELLGENRRRLLDRETE